MQPSFAIESRLVGWSRLASWAMALLLIATVWPGALHAADTTPRQFLTALYKSYSGPDAMGLSWRGSTAERYFDAALTKLILRDVNEAKGEIGRIDFDPFVAAQDFEIASLAIAIESESAEAATGLVSFTNLGQRTKIRYDLAKTAKGWRIANITWDEPTDLKGDLRSILARAL
ncbi:DUF3828 domain-containing protein [Microvirga sp. 17 mud 1-3]|uniref:DUF3828 domain-containing protein n=1 Tax=Microvirga sp. 17 mud 1-3 TaxID=2082949 RepID=UPI0013A56027|nr:DUF3828 domain-containing protein [Microvirga sp. 17 mud 1-3]